MSACILTDGDGAGAAEDDDVQQRVRPEPVGAVHRGAGRLAGRVEPRHDRVRVVGRRLHHLAAQVGWDAAHVVVHGGNHRDWLLFSAPSYMLVVMLVPHLSVRLMRMPPITGNGCCLRAPNGPQVGCHGCAILKELGTRTGHVLPNLRHAGLVGTA